MLATGGIGKSYKVTSNSWEYTGDGHALALRAGATLINMEFLQFHPTGMVWPPSVKGILVTESVRGDGGVLQATPRASGSCSTTSRTSSTSSTPRPRRRATAGTPTRTTTGARPSCCPATRWPARSTPRSRPAAARPHGGVFLDIASRLPPEEILKRLPSMYHQFKELADVDITKEPMEVGPTCHYVMGGVEVDPDTAMSIVPGPVRGRRGAPAACTAPTGSAATRCPTCWCSAAGPGSAPREYVDGLGRARPPVVDADVDAARGPGAAPFSSATDGGENPYTVHRSCRRR